MCESCRRRGNLVPKLAPPNRPWRKQLWQDSFDRYESEMRRMIDLQMKYQNARLEMDIIRVLARFPWYLHVLAKNPHVWGVFKRPRATPPAGGTL